MNDQEREKELLAEAAKLRLNSLGKQNTCKPIIPQKAMGSKAKQPRPLKELEQKVEDMELRWKELRDGLLQGIPPEQLDTIRAVIRAEERETLRHEFETMLEEAYEQAYDMVKTSHDEYTKRVAEIDEMWSDADNRLKDIKNFMVDKIDQFLDAHIQQCVEDCRLRELNGEKVFKAAFTKKYPSIDDQWGSSKEDFERKRDEIKRKMRDDPVD